MVHLNGVLNPYALVMAVGSGHVTIREHNELPLAIANYTPAAAYAREWNEVTTRCRGLIYNTETMEVVARPFPKFFNWDESGSIFPPSGPALRMEKMDGSLGILYPATGQSAIATRGSFHSEQAEWATNWYNENAPGEFEPDLAKTYLFEIIYPDNRIVVDYGDYEGLVLIDVIDNETGFSDTDEFDNCDWPDKVTRTPVPGFDSGQVVDIPDGEEGFVFLWPTRNFRTKMKSARYVEIHRLVSNLTPKSVWEQMVDGKTLDQIKEPLPEEFHPFVDEVYGDLSRQARDRCVLLWSRYEAIRAGLPEGWSRAEFAGEAVKHGSDSKHLFTMLDGRSPYLGVLKELKPRP